MLYTGIGVTVDGFSAWAPWPEWPAAKSRVDAAAGVAGGGELAFHRS